MIFAFYCFPINVFVLSISGCEFFSEEIDSTCSDVLSSINVNDIISIEIPIVHMFQKLGKFSVTTL